MYLELEQATHFLEDWPRIPWRIRSLGVFGLEFSNALRKALVLSIDFVCYTSSNKNENSHASRRSGMAFRVAAVRRFFKYWSLQSFAL